MSPSPSSEAVRAHHLASGIREGPARLAHQQCLVRGRGGRGLLLLLVIFIVQNTQYVEVSFLGWDGRAPLSVSLLVASLVGILLAVVAGSLRILQLRRPVRRVRD